MSQEKEHHDENNRWPQLWGLIAVTSVVGVAAFLLICFLLTRGVYHPGSVAEISSDGKNALWYDSKKGDLKIVDLSSFLAVSTFHALAGARQFEWSQHQPSMVYFRKYRYGLASDEVTRIDIENIDENTLAVDDLSRFNPLATDELMTINWKGDRYVAQTRSFTNSTPKAAIALFKSVPPHKNHYITHSAVSENGRFLAVSLGGAGDPVVEVIDLEERRSMHVFNKRSARFLAFNSTNTRLIGVRSLGARVSLHLYNLETGEEIASTPEIHGWVNTAQVTPDFTKLYLSCRPGDDRDRADFQIYSTSSLAKLDSVQLPKEKGILDVHLNDDHSCLMIGRSGRLWQWHPDSDTLTKLGKINRSSAGNYWLWAGFLLAVFVSLIVVMFRKRSGIKPPIALDVSSAPKKKSILIYLLVIVIFVEIGRLVISITQPMFLISQTNIYLFGGHALVALILIVASVLAAILRMPKWPLLLLIMLVMVSGAVINLIILVAAIASV